MPDAALLFVAAATAAVCSVATAVATARLTKRREERRQRELWNEQHRRQKLLKEKTAAARRAKHEPPSGTLLGDVYVDRVYLWECEDLRKRFPSANAENVMRFKDSVRREVIQSPLLRQPGSPTNQQEAPMVAQHTSSTHYNKIITDHECILGDVVRKPNMPTHTVAYMRAGPRRHLHFDPSAVNAAIVTCGGLCPGLNNVIREITKTLHQLYGICGTVYGIQGGYKGFYDTATHLQPVVLTPELVENIHHEGGTVLGSSRGGFDLDKILDFVHERNISQLYVIGGDGTHRGAFRIHEGCMERGYNVAVAGIPKTIDNDVDCTCTPRKQ
jgi:6-phosphofructokinase 1